MGDFTGVDAQLKAVQNQLKDIKVKALEDIKRAARIVQQEMYRRTPVWEGDTVRNFQWGRDTAPSGHKEPVASPATGFGGTNEMALGEEPRRRANEAAATADLEGVLSGVNDWTNLVLTNTGADWALVDSGAGPGAPFKSRNPGGVAMLAIQSARARLEKWK